LTIFVSYFHIFVQIVNEVFKYYILECGG
jgi:hypothetical protein